jgi:hypothetical protein
MVFSSSRMLAVVRHHRQHALLQYHLRVGFPVALGRILEAGTEQAGVKPGGRGLRRIDIGAAQTGITFPLVARTGNFHRLEARAAAYDIGDGLIDGLAIELLVAAGRVSGADGGVAAPMLVIGLVVHKGAKSAQQIVLGSVGLEGCHLRHVLIARAGGLGQIQHLGQPAAPEECAEAHGNGLAGGGQGLAIAVQKTIQQGQRHHRCRTLKKPAKEKSAI